LLSTSSARIQSFVDGVLIENSFFSRPNEFLREIRERTAQPQTYRG
jgi:hypothetical protein